MSATPFADFDFSSHPRILEGLLNAQIILYRIREEERDLMTPCGNEFGYLYLHDLMHTLWEQHASWTRAAIVSIAEGLADEDAVTRRLLRNPADLAAVFRPLYGDAIAVQLEHLIRDHLVIAAQLVRAAKAGQTAEAAEIARRWYANADAIAAFMGAINPYWSEAEMRQMWHQHLAFVKAQAMGQLNKDYISAIAAYDAGEELILEMADEFTEGIIQQFGCCF
jgi:hypothetical protein